MNYLLNSIKAFMCLLLVVSSLNAMYGDGPYAYRFDGKISKNKYRPDAECEKAISDLANADSGLKELSLKNLRLMRLPKFLKRFTQLRELTLAHNKLAEEDVEVVRHFTHLRHLNLKDNCFRRVPTAVADLPELCGLNLGRNFFTNTESDLGKLEELETLDLSDNFIELLDPSIGKLSELQTLLLNGNHLQDLPMSLNDLPRLRLLILSHNRFAKMPNAVKRLMHKYDGFTVCYNAGTQHKAQNPKKLA